MASSTSFSATTAMLAEDYLARVIHGERLTLTGIERGELAKRRQPTQRYDRRVSQQEVAGEGIALTTLSANLPSRWRADR